MSNQNPASSPSTLVANMPTSNVEPIVDTLNWVLTASVAVVLVLRVHSKDRRRTPLWWDDYIMWTSWVRGWGEKSKFTGKDAFY